MRYTHVHTPYRVRDVEIRNRIVRTAHASNLGGGTVNDSLIAYHAARARGGVGLSIIETLAVHPSAPKTINIFAPGVAGGYRRMVDVIRPLGMRLFQQLWHGGHNGVPLDGGAPWSSSDIPSPSYGAVPIPMTPTMIDTLVDSFATAAQKCEAWGIEGVELNAAHGYIFAQFMSPNCNKREDDHGGSFENRTRLLADTLTEIRARVSPDYPVGIRLSVEPVVNGVGGDELARLATDLEARGLIDFLNVSLGNYQSLDQIVGGMHEPIGYQLPTSGPITHKVSVPTIVTGRFRTLEEADQVIRSGDADMVSMVRALVADPDIVDKSLSGHAERVRPCIACNQGCIGGTSRPPFRMGCAVNPAIGEESTIGDDRLVMAEPSRRVVVIGGGPAGMEAARVSRLRGHAVTLHEARSALGGLVNVAALAPTRHGIADIVKWQESEIFRLGVDVRLSSYVEADDIRPEDADAVIVATGSRPRMDGIPISNPGEPIRGVELPHVRSSIEVMTAPPTMARAAVVIDDVGHYEAVAVAEFLVRHGCRVTFATRFPAFAPDMEGAFMNVPALSRLYRGGFTLMTRTRAVAIRPDTVLLAPTFMPASSNQVAVVDADLVVMVSHNRPNREIFDLLSSSGADVRIVGDAQMPRNIQQAVRDGHLAGAAV